MAFPKPYQQHNYFMEKMILKEEEKSLKEMLTKFQDQLNRLKIEELALQSHIKMQAEANKSETVQNRSGASSSQAKSEYARSETNSSITSVVPVGIRYEKAAPKARDLEQEIEELDLEVRNDPGPYSSQGFGEEEEEEDDEDGDSKHLYSYMDSL